MKGVSTWSGDEEEWREWREVGDPVLHIELRRWADCLVVAPLSANTLAKCAQGLCDNLLTCVVSRLLHLLGPSIIGLIAGLLQSAHCMYNASHKRRLRPAVNV